MYKRISEVKSKVNALLHFKVDPALEIDATFNSSLELCEWKANRLSSAKDGNVEFVHSQYRCMLTSQVSTVLCVRQKH